MKRPLIESNPAVMMGKPVVVGTRITVELILEKLGAGMSTAELLEGYPHLTPGDVHAALRSAADYLNEDYLRERIQAGGRPEPAAGARALVAAGRRIGLRPGGERWRQQKNTCSGSDLLAHKESSDELGRINSLRTSRHRSECSWASNSWGPEHWDARVTSQN